MLSSKNKEKIYIKCIERIKSTSESNKLKFISKLLFESFESWIFCGFYFQEYDKLLVSEYCASLHNILIQEVYHILENKNHKKSNFQMIQKAILK